MLNRSKIQHKKLFIICLVVILALSALAIAFTYFCQYLPDLEKRTSIQANVEASSFSSFTCPSLDCQTNSVNVFGEPFNVTIPIGGSNLEWLNVVQDSADNAVFDTVIHNSSGNANIILTNIISLQYQRTDGNNTANLRFDETVDSFIPSISYPISTPNSDYVVISPVSNPSTCYLSVASDDTAKLFISIGAHNGSLQITGSDNYSINIANDYVGLLLEVKIPYNGHYITEVSGDFKNINVPCWQSIDYFFDRFGGRNGSFYLNNVRGDVYYSDQSKQCYGTNDLNFTDVTGHVQVSPLNSQFYQVTVTGDAKDLVSSSEGVKTTLTGKNFLPDYLWSSFPFAMTGITGLLFVGMTLAFYKFWYVRWDLLVILSVNIFCFGSIFWAVATGKEIWVETTLGVAAAITTIITLVAKGERRRQTEVNKKNTNKAPCAKKRA